MIPPRVIDQEHPAVLGSCIGAWFQDRVKLTPTSTSASRNGTFVLPPASVQEVERVIMAVVAAPDKDGAEFQAAADTLMALQAACVSRLVPVA